MANDQHDTDETIRDLASANQELAARLAAAERRDDPTVVMTRSQAAITSDPQPSVSRVDRRIARAMTWPVRRVFNPRFGGLTRQIDEKQIDLFDRLDHLRDEALAINHERAQAQSDLGDLAKYQADQLALAVSLLEAQLEASAETTAIVGRTLANIRDDTQETGKTLQSFEMSLSEVGTTLSEVGTTLSDLPGKVSALAQPDLVRTGEVSALGEDVARLLNFANSHVGFAAQRRLWINHPVGLEYTAGNVRASNVNERIVEVPYAMRALYEIAPPATIVDVGAAQSTLSLALASLGYRVTAVDPNGYPFDHPNLEVLETPLAALPEDRSFDASLCISTIEHIGLATYGQQPSAEESDLTTIRRLRQALTPGGLLVLTVPFGTARTDKCDRTYDRSGLDRLLDGWRVLDITIVTRESGLTWTPSQGDSARGDSVALVTARSR